MAESVTQENTSQNAILLPPAENAPKEEKKEAHPKTEKEALLDTLIGKRQSILDKLKEKNPQVMEARKRIAEAIPLLRGKGGSHTMELVRESERIEFAIATEADTPKKEKELLKRLREIKQELSKHKELDAARKKVDAERSALNTILSEVKTLESELAETRKACDAAYAEVLSERKSAYESRERKREGARQERFDKLRRTVRDQKRHEEDKEMEKYMKDYDDTVSMEEIVVFEKKERKKEEEAKEE